MALLNPVDQAPALARRTNVRLNWRLILALVATGGFWVGVGQAVVRLV